jgi:putative membrane protein insertion efficiency factor
MIDHGLQFGDSVVEASASPTTAPRPALASSPALAAVDAFACAALPLAASVASYLVDPFHVMAGWVHVLLVLPFALLGPFGAGMDRGRASLLLGAVLGLGAALGSLAGAWLIEASSDPVVLAARALVPLLLGPPLARFGARFPRHEEEWRAFARTRPPEATPAFALRLASARLPLALRVLAAPVLLALAPLGGLALVLIRCYQLAVSRLLPPQCRFEPSCSRYGFEAFWKHGALKGFLLTAFRLLRCHPFCRAGHDPVPERPL